MDPLPAEAKFIVPDGGDKVDYGLGLSYRPASLMAGRYDNPMSKSTLSPQSGTKNLATGRPHRPILSCGCRWGGGGGLCKVGCSDFNNLIMLIADPLIDAKIL
jgi:hypothetical protein